MPTISELYLAHIEDLTARADRGDESARKTLACISLITSGWRYGDPDPDESEATLRESAKIIRMADYWPVHFDPPPPAA